MLKSNGSRIVAGILLAVLALELQATGKIGNLIHLATTHAAGASSSASSAAPASSAASSASSGPPLILAGQHIGAEAAQGDPAAQGMTF